MAEPMPNPWSSGETANDNRTRPATATSGIVPSPGIHMTQDGPGGDLLLNLGYTVKKIPLNDYINNPIKVQCGASCCPCCVGDPSLCAVEHKKDLKKLRTSFSVWIAVIDILLLLVTLFVGGFEDPGRNPMLGPPAQTLSDFGAKVTPLIKAGEVWRLVTPMFLHAGIIHLLMNTMAQLFIGVPMEFNIGTLKTTVVYFVGGILGNLMSAVGNPNGLGVGASGAILGLAGCQAAYLAVLWKAIAPRVRKTQLLSTVMFLVLLFLIGTSSGIDNLAHFGGLLGGFLCGVFIFAPYTPSNQPGLSKKLQLGTCAVLAVVYVIFLLALFV